MTPEARLLAIADQLGEVTKAAAGALARKLLGDPSGAEALEYAIALRQLLCAHDGVPGIPFPVEASSPPVWSAEEVRRLMEIERCATCGDMRGLHATLDGGAPGRCGRPLCGCARFEGRARAWRSS